MMIKLIFLFFSIFTSGCFINLNKNNKITKIEENCFVEINNYNENGHTYILELPVKKNNLIKFEWWYSNVLTNIKFSWFNTTNINLIPYSYNLYYDTGSIKLQYENNKDFYHCNNLECTKYSNESKSGNVYIYITSNAYYLSGTYNFILETFNRHIKIEQLNLLKNMWDKCCSDRYINKPLGNYKIDSITHCSWTPTLWKNWSNINENSCEEIHNIDCDENGNIQHIYLSNQGLKCNLNEIKEFKNLKYLELIDLSYNYIESDIKIFKDINNLYEINLAYNYFYGNINELNIKNVNKINLEYNKIYGNVDLFTANHNKLKIFNIGYNYFDIQSIPKFNYDIEYISVARNNFNGKLDSVKEYKEIKLFDISFNNFESDEEINFLSLKNLQVLNVRYNNFKKLFLLSENVKYYDTSYNIIDDNLEKLNVLNEAYIDISNNIIDIVFNDSIKQLINKNMIKLDDNIFRCVNGTKYFPYWVYHYYPNINVCKSDDTNIIDYYVNNYYVEFIIMLIFCIVFIIILIIGTIYFYNKNKRLIDIVEKETLI